MMKAALVVHAVLLGTLAVGCARTPAMTTTAAPAPSGDVTSSGGPRGTDGAVRPAAGKMSTTATTRVPIEQFKPAAQGTLNDVYFDFDKYEITAESAKSLDANADWLKANPNVLILIEGHCDERGTAAYNLALGERRAKATQNYLSSRGVQASRVSLVSYGEERPVCSEHTEACWAKNRRSHFMVKPQ